MELTFDEMAVDTTLAQDYLQKSEQLLTSNLSLWYDGSVHYESHELDKYILKDFHVNQTKLHNLANKLKENMNLFAQLEYLSGDIPIEDSKAQINIIIEQLKYASYRRSSKVSYNENEPKSALVMYKDSPLLMLGIAAKVLTSSEYLWIHVEKSRADICILFTQLCHEAGLPVFTMIYPGFKSSHMEGRLQNLPVGAIGIITEHSDVDSAVDMFLTSSNKAPWRLQIILVQESVSQQFKDAMTWKCKENESSNTLEYNGRVFHLDQLGMNNLEESDVYIDTYRTTKELLSLLAEHPSFYLSLWANNIAEINQIIYSVPTPVVWVNNFADFRGPSKVTEAFYPYAKLKTKQCGFRENVEFDELLKLRKSWLKITIEARREIVCKVLTSCDLAEVSSIASVMNCTNDSFVYVDKDYVCTGISNALDKPIYIENAEEAYENVEFYESIVLGNTYIVSLGVIDENWIEIIKKLKAAKVPIAHVRKADVIDDSKDFVLYKNDYKMPKQTARTMRIIWTNSGTTFAN